MEKTAIDKRFSNDVDNDKERSIFHRNHNKSRQVFGGSRKCRRVFSFREMVAS